MGEEIMCGIVGISSQYPIFDRGWLIAGREALRHRGPDDAGEWWSADGRVGMGHRRLAIIDLSTTGHQPMNDATGELCIVFNGEIYNFGELRLELIGRGHTFRSRTDTEVILATYREWGSDCLSHLNGMFAFGLYDTTRRRLFIARDRAGEKPLFYSLTSGVLRFSSELKGLMADPSLPRCIDPAALDCYLSMGYVPGARCMLRGVNKLPPAHALQFDLDSGEARVWRYWDLPELDPTAAAAKVDEVALLDNLEHLLQNAVRSQLVADVPVGVLLSGGVDSSLITAMAARTLPRVKTFTIRFTGYGQYDETEYARLIAKHFDTEHVELEAAESNVDLLPLLARQFDEPLVDSSMIPTYLVSRIIRQHCTVALGGDGGDELFAGYSHYSHMMWLQRRGGRISLALRKCLANAAETLLPIGLRGRSWLQGLATDFESGLPRTASHFDRSTRCRLMAAQHNWALTAESIREQRIPNSPDLLQRATRMDFCNYLPEDILAKVDRASMLNSLEVRSPMLDYRLIEFAFRMVPSQLKATPNARKVLLKKLTARLLPPSFDQERKQGFAVPLGAWLHSGPWKTFFHEVLLDSSNNLFTRRAVSNLLEGQARGRANSERLFALVMFELWRREYQVSI